MPEKNVKVFPMKSIQFRGLTLVLLLASISACSIGSTKYYTHHEAVLAQDGTTRMSGLDGLVTISNKGPDKVRVRVTSRSGALISEQDLRPHADCGLTLSPSETLEIVNPSKSETAIEILSTS